MVSIVVNTTPSEDVFRYAGPEADLVDDQKVMATRVTMLGDTNSYWSQPWPAVALHAEEASPSTARAGCQSSNCDEARAHGGVPHVAAVSDSD